MASCLLSTPPAMLNTCGLLFDDVIVSQKKAGGLDGREVTDKLLPMIPSLLTPRTGRFYLIAINENIKPGTDGEGNQKQCHHPQTQSPVFVFFSFLFTEKAKTKTKEGIRGTNTTAAVAAV